MRCLSNFNGTLQSIIEAFLFRVYCLLRESVAFIIELISYIQFKLTLFLENRNHTQNLI